MSNVKADRLLQFLRMEYRAIVVQDVEVNWRCPSWTAQTACSEGVEPTPPLCAACPVKAECLVTALVVDDPAPIRGGLPREDRTAAFLAIEQDAFHLDDWLRDRAQGTPVGVVMLATVGQITAGMARELAEAEGVCARPLLRRVTDRETGAVSRVALACGSTREVVCPACAGKARRLRMQQCAEGWHRTDEPEADTAGITENETEPGDTGRVEDEQDPPDTGGITTGRRVRSTKRRQEVPDLPHVPMSSRTVGVVFSGKDGNEHRPSMFVTLTLPSYGAIQDGAPTSPATYDYRRAALDAILFPRLLDQFWKTLRRSAGFNVQYFSAIEPQRRLAPHLHAAIRGAIPRQVLRQVVAATYLQVWWPAFDQAVYTDELPRWTGTDYADPDTGELLPTWDEALDAIDNDPDATPAHVMLFGSQLDVQGIVRGQPDADRAIRYLTKYITKDVAGIHDGDQDARHKTHVDRLHRELRYLPCSERCANWLRYGVQPKQAGPGLAPGFCSGRAHRREHLGLGGRRVLVSRKWSSKTLARHRADRAEVVREALESAGIVAPDVERLSAGVNASDGRARFVWEQIEGDQSTYAQVVLMAVAERRRWRAEYESARDTQQARSAMPPVTANCFGLPRLTAQPWVRAELSRVSEANHEVTRSALDGADMTHQSLPNVGEGEANGWEDEMQTDEASLPALLTSAEVAAWLKVNRSTLSRWRTDGVGPRVTWLSGSIPRYQRAHVIAWLQKVAS